MSSTSARRSAEDAENPLSQDVKGDTKGGRGDIGVVDKEAEEIGNYETEQLINAITNIANLLRKCWGVAGADIITSNLKRTKDGKTVVFNPTVPGKRVYALFGFVAINGFSDQLRALDRDVMILINDVASGMCCMYSASASRFLSCPLQPSHPNMYLRFFIVSA